MRNPLRGAARWLGYTRTPVRSAPASRPTAPRPTRPADSERPPEVELVEQEDPRGALVGAEGVTLLTTVDQIDPLYVNFTMSSSELQSLRQAQGQGTEGLGHGCAVDHRQHRHAKVARQVGA